MDADAIKALYAAASDALPLLERYVQGEDGITVAERLDAALRAYETACALRRRIAEETDYAAHV